MMNQEHYMELHSLKNEGWTNREIAGTWLTAETETGAGSL